MENRIVSLCKFAAFLAILWAATQPPPPATPWPTTENVPLYEKNVLLSARLSE